MVTEVTMDRLVVVGAREHNLKNVSLSLPRGKLVVFTGPSGSGKSSLAFDTIYAEGQRRYVESLSAYARQFLEQLGKPDVERIDGLSPAIAIEQRPLSRSPRSTVGTVTEIADYLRLLFARVGVPHCPSCGKRIEAQTVQQITDRIAGLGEGSRLSLLAPICRARKGELKLELERLRREGFVRARIDGQLVDLGDDLALDRSRPHDLDVVVDRVVLKEGVLGRLTDSVELALKLGEGRLLVLPALPAEGAPLWLSERFACVDCGVSLPPIEPRLFSFNGPHGACPSCDGLGARTAIEPRRVIGEPHRTLREGVVLAWGRRGSVALAMECARATAALSVDADVPWQQLSEAHREALLFGVDPASSKKDSASASATTRQSKSKKQAATTAYEGIVPRLEARLAGQSLTTRERDGGDDAEPDETEGAIADDELGRFSEVRTCAACGGLRLRPEALAVRLAGRDITTLGALPLDRLAALVRDLESDAAALTPRERTIAEPLLKAIGARIGFLVEVGLGYLSLDRSAQTLSSGEGQRIRLATQIGAALVGVLYVLDEPSVGLHARDNARLIEAQAPPPRSRQHRARRRARPRGDPRGRPRGRPRPRRRGARRPRRRRGHAGRAHGEPGFGHRAVALRRPRALPAGGATEGAQRSPLDRRGARAQPEERGRRRPARPLHLLHRGLGLGQIEPRGRHPAAGRSLGEVRRAGRRRRLRQGARPRPRRQGREHRPGPHRPHAALEPGHLHRRLRAAP